MSIPARWRQALTNKKTLVRGLINFAISLSSFVVTCMSLHAILPFPEIDEVSQKLRYFAEHRNEFDTIFVGSSRTHHQISPSIFDEVMLGNGTPTRSFNFGVNGMSFPELGYLLEQALSTKPPNLKWVVVEFDELQVDWLSQGEGSRRALYWHDWKRTSLVLRKLLGAGAKPIWLPSAKKVLRAILHRSSRQLVVFHISQFQKDFTNLGRAADVWDHFLNRGEPGNVRWLGQGLDGYRPTLRKMPPAQVRDYEEMLALALKKTAPERVSVYTDKAARQCAEKIRELGAVPIFLVHATPKVQTELKFHSKPPGAVLSFNDARTYPNLFRPDARVDRTHLNKKGSEEFSRLMALKFAEFLNAGKIQ